jgi:hypothetical protein
MTSHAERVEMLERDEQQRAILKRLAAEREEREQLRNRAAQAPFTPALTPQAAARKHTVKKSLSPLQSAHRTVQLAHSSGCVLCATGLTLLMLLSRSSGSVYGALLLLAGVGLARGGGTWLHSVLPAMLREGAPPKSTELAVDDGLFAGKGPFDSNAWAQEGQVALESLAWCCTYGKKNCLTSDMYRGDLSLGKVWRLVYGKLSEGIVRC